MVQRLSVLHGDSGAPPVYDKAELEVLVTDQRENLARKNKRKEVKQGPPNKKRKFATNTISRFSYKETRRDEEKMSSKSEVTDLSIAATSNVERKIVPSAEVITRNSFKGKPDDKELEPTTNAKVAKKLNSNPKQTKISSFIYRK